MYLSCNLWTSITTYCTAYTVLAPPPTEWNPEPNYSLLYTEQFHLPRASGWPALSSQQHWGCELGFVGYPVCVHVHFRWNRNFSDFNFLSHLSEVCVDKTRNTEVSILEINSLTPLQLMKLLYTVVPLLKGCFVHKLLPNGVLYIHRLCCLTSPVPECRVYKLGRREFVCP